LLHIVFPSIIIKYPVMILKVCRLIVFIKLNHRMMNIIQIVAKNIKKYRLLKDLTQEQLAELSGLHRTYVGSVERAERNLSLENLERIAKALGVSPRDLLDKDSK
jgi:DNA-binding XRE family transcriptional regulator